MYVRISVAVVYYNCQLGCARWFCKLTNGLFSLLAMAYKGVEGSDGRVEGRPQLPPATDLDRWSLEVDEGRQVRYRFASMLFYFVSPTSFLKNKKYIHGLVSNASVHTRMFVLYQVWNYLDEGEKAADHANAGI